MTEVRPGPLTQATAEAITQLLRREESHVPQSAPQAPLQSLSGGLFVNDAFTPEQTNLEFWAKITEIGTDSNEKLYGWIQVAASTNFLEGWSEVLGGLSGGLARHPAYESNDRKAKVGDVVRLSRARFDATLDWMYVFSVGGSEGDSFTAKITNKKYVSGVVVYEWIRQDETVGTPPEFVDGDQSGTFEVDPAYEENNVDLPYPSFVRLRKGEGDYYWIDEQPRWEFVRKIGVQDADGDFPGHLLRWNQDFPEGMEPVLDKFGEPLVIYIVDLNLP